MKTLKTRKHYINLSIEPIGLVVENNLLDGSVTENAVKTNSVTVEPYSYGFEDASHNDVGFDITFDN